MDPETKLAPDTTCVPLVVSGTRWQEEVNFSLQPITSGEPHGVAMGSMTVLIGKKPAARMGSMTAHGGSVVMGYPTVLIGGDVRRGRQPLGSSRYRCGTDTRD